MNTLQNDDVKQLFHPIAHVDLSLDELQESLERPDIESLKCGMSDMVKERRRQLRSLRIQVAEGTYQPDNTAVSRSIIRTAAGDAWHRGKIGLNRWPYSQID